MAAWFDIHPSAYWMPAWAGFAVLVLLALGPLVAGLFAEKAGARLEALAPRWLFVAVLAAAFFAFRWPLLYVNEELNPDESQIIAGALALQHDPVYWRAVDGQTHGPLDVYPLLVAGLFGRPMDFASARLTGSLLMLAAVLALYRTLACFQPEGLARAGCLPAFCFFAFSTFWDFVHYSSEHAPVCLLALGVWLLAAELAGPGDGPGRPWRWFGAGLALGAVPLAKLQGTPTALALLLVGALLVLGTAGRPFARRLRLALMLAAGALALPGFFLLLNLLTGQVRNVWISYIVQNLLYAAQSHYTREEMLRQFWEYARIGPGFYALAAGSAVFIGVTLLRTPGFPRPALRLLLLAAVFFLASLVAVLTPGRQFTHYLLWLVVPTVLLAAALLGGWWDAAAAGGPRAGLQRGLALACFAGLALAPQVVERVRTPHPWLGRWREYATRPVPPVVAKIRQYARPGEALGMWGWMCRYYVLTGLRPATREAHTERLINFTPNIHYYRARYLADLKRSNPPVFADAVGPGNFTYEIRNVAHELVPELAAFIAARYTEVADVDGTRIYVRNDRLGKP